MTFEKAREILLYLRIVTLILVVLAVRASNRGILLPAALAVLVLSLVLAQFWLRCPGCGKVVGKPMFAEHCPYRGQRLI